jgi:3-hydroxyisobutyrate dehydrogenase-like beta-hydroxyacid dehydrogenase
LGTPGAAKAAKLAAEAGAIACESPADVAAHAECTFVCVGNSKMSEKVIDMVEENDQSKLKVKNEFKTRILCF